MSTKSQQKIRALIKEFGITDEAFCSDVGLPIDSLQEISLSPHEDLLAAIVSVLSAVKPWFKLPAEAWCWFREQPIASLGNLTPAEVLMQHHTSGHEALMSFIQSKELGGFD